MTLGTGWPSAADIALRAKVTLTGETTKTAYDLDVAVLLERAYWHMCEHCGRSRTLGFDASDVEDEMHEAGERIFVRHPPIVSMTEVLWNESELTEDEDFWVEPDHIYIPLRTMSLERTHPFRRLPQHVSLSYTGGYSNAEEGTVINIPLPLIECLTEIAVIWLLRIDEHYRLDKNATKVTIGKYAASFRPQEDELKEVEKRLATWVIGM